MDSGSDVDRPRRAQDEVRESSAPGHDINSIHMHGRRTAADPTDIRTSSIPSLLFQTSSSAGLSNANIVTRASSPPSSPPHSSPLQSTYLASNNGQTGRTSQSRPEFHETSMPLLRETTLRAAEKDGDDTSVLPTWEWPQLRVHSTPQALTRLLGSHTYMSPEGSRSTSYAHGNLNLIQHDSPSATSLHDHLYTRGLLGGKHSDVAVIAFGHKYDLHRLILDRAPFFTSALSGPWVESTAREVVLHPEEVDPTITQKAFELVLKRLYGCDIRSEEDAEAVGLFAAGCWLEMQDLVDSAIESILRQMGPETLSPLIRLVTNNYYGPAGDRILASAKAMLCRDGWEMTLKHWDDIPGEIVREIVGGDGFYIPGEWDRWVLSRRLLDRRLRQKAGEYGLTVAGSRANTSKPPDSLGSQAIRINDTRKFDYQAGSQLEKWLLLYTDIDIEPILVLLDQGIHYVHLEFERLQYIRQAKDILGLPMLPEAVITHALWQQLELRQRVLNAREGDLELGLSQPAEEYKETPESPTHIAPSSKGKEKIRASPQEEPEQIEIATKPRKFWIPSSDCNIVMGGNAEPVITTSASSTFSRLASRISAVMEPSDLVWATDFAALPSTSADHIGHTRIPARPASAGSDTESTAHPTPVAYSKFPPFRFAAEFPNPKSLKEKKRVYSKTVFYAGSYWNIYIQKVRSQKNPQLGVYLHRAKDREPEDREKMFLTSLSSAAASSVDERIGLLEREMHRRGADHRRSMTRPGIVSRHGDRGAETEDDGSMAAYRRRTYGAEDMRESAILDTSYTAFDSDSDSSARSSPRGTANFVDGLDTSDIPPPSSSLTQFPPPTTTANTSRLKASDRMLSDLRHSFVQARRSNPTIPTYNDARPTIKTYFKIYSPSKGGRLLSVYESAPDKFDFSQSWGWKSSTLMLDEGFGPQASPAPDFGANPVGMEREGDDGISAANNAAEAGVNSSLAMDLEKERKMEREQRRRREGTLRFMVVIGNL